MPEIYMPVKIPDTKMLNQLGPQGGPMYLLQKDFQFLINNINFVVPNGFVFDQASTPRWLWSAFPPAHPDYVAASLLHDLGYAGELWPRKFMDQLFLGVLIANGVKRCKRNLMYWGVRVGGGFTYKEHTIKRIKEVRSLLGVDFNGVVTRPLWPAGFIPGFPMK